MVEGPTEVPQKKVDIEAPRDAAIPFLGLFPKESKAGSQRCLYTRIHSSIIPFKTTATLKAIDLPT